MTREARKTSKSLEELARACGWRSVPQAWEGLPAGAMFDCPNDPKVGQSITKRGRTGVITSCATPLPLGRSVGKSRDYRCQGAYGVKWDDALFSVPVRKSQVREAGRKRELCKYAGKVTLGMVEGWREEGIKSAEDLRRAGILPAGDVPFPHRKGGHVACHYAPLAVEVRAMVASLERKLAPRARAAAARELRDEDTSWPPKKPVRAEVERRAAPRARALAEERASQSELGRQLDAMRAQVWEAKIDALLAPRSGLRADIKRLRADQERASSRELALAEAEGRSVEVLADRFAEELDSLQRAYGSKKKAARRR